MVFLWLKKTCKHVTNSDDTLHHEPGSNGLPNLGFFKYNTKAAYFAYEGGAVTGPNGVVEGPDGVNSIYVIGYDESNLMIRRTNLSTYSNKTYKKTRPNGRVFYSGYSVRSE